MIAAEVSRKQEPILAEMLLAVVEAGESNLGRSLTAIEAVDLGGNHKRCCVTSRVT